VRSLLARPWARCDAEDRGTRIKFSSTTLPLRLLLTLGLALTSSPGSHRESAWEQNVCRLRAAARWTSTTSTPTMGSEQHALKLFAGAAATKNW